MAGQLKYQMGVGELSSRKDRLWNALLAEFVGKMFFILFIYKYTIFFIKFFSFNHFVIYYRD